MLDKKKEKTNSPALKLPRASGFGELTVRLVLSQTPESTTPPQAQTFGLAGYVVSSKEVAFGV